MFVMVVNACGTKKALRIVAKNVTVMHTMHDAARRKSEGILVPES